jgi:hypothetical protein
MAVMAIASMLFTGSAHALTNLQFSLSSDPSTAVVDLSHITTPPLPGQPVTISENLKDENGQLAGSAIIACHVVAFTLSDLLLDCQATFNLTNGTISGHTVFWTFQHNYPAIVLNGTGAYQGVVGTAQVLDRSPGDETYNFNLIRP